MSDTSHVADLVDDFVHDLLPADKAVAVVLHCNHCPDCQTALQAAHQRLAVLQTVPPVEPAPHLVEKTVDAVVQHAAPGRRKRRIFGWLTAAAAGVAIVLTSFHLYYANLSASPYDLVVLGQRELIAGASGSMRIILTDKVANKPLVRVPVQIVINRPGVGPTPQKDSIVLDKFLTDENGVAEPRFNLPDHEGEFELTVRAEIPNAPEVITRKVHVRRSWRLLLSSDKPVYQPGQTIKLRALALRLPSGKPVAEENAMFTIVDPKGNLIYKQATTTSTFGITSAECALADEVIEGAYVLLCQVGDTESRLAVEVSKYVLPRIKLAVELDKPFYKPGDEAKATIRADYFFGKPVTNAAVTLKASGSFAEPLEIPALRTDANGRAEITFEVPKLPNDNGETTLMLEATVVDTAGQKQTNKAERTVTKEQYRLEVITEGNYLVAGIPNRILVMTTTADGRPVSVPVRIVEPIKLDLQTDERGLGVFTVTPGEQVMRSSLWIVGERGEVTAWKRDELWSNSDDLNFLFHTDRASYRGGDTVKLTVVGRGSEPVFVDFRKSGAVRQMLLTHSIPMKEGKGELSIDLPADVTGTITLEAYRLARTGHQRRIRNGIIHVRVPEQLRLSITPASGAAEYRPQSTEKLKMTLTDASGKPTPGAFSLAAVDESVFAVAQQNKSAGASLDRDLLQPSFDRRPWLRNLANRIESGTASALEQELFAVSTKEIRRFTNPRDHNIDESPFYETVDEQDLRIATYQPKLNAITALKEDRLDWMRTIWVWWILAAGALVLAAVIAFTPPSELLRIVQGAGLVLIPLLLIVILMKSETNVSNTFNYVSGQVKGGSGGRANEWSESPPEERFDGRIFARKRSRIDDAFLGLDERMVTSLSDTPTPITRRHFPETLVWQPQVITDDKGHASVDLTFADSITTWRLNASAVDANGRLGATEVPLRVVQPFFIDLTLPVSLTRGDEVTVPVVLHNYTDQRQIVTLSFKHDDAIESRPMPVDGVKVEKGAVTAVNYRLRAERAGQFDLEVRADGQGVSDKLIRRIEVVPDGVRQEFPFSGSLDRVATLPLDVPEKAIDGSVRATVRIYPSGFAQLVEGLDGIFRMPNGCFEQTSSSTYPNVLALDYLQRTRQSRPDVEKKAKGYIHTGYQRLLTFEVHGGGFSWYGKAPAVRTLTAYGLMQFTDMARVHDVDPKLIERTRIWLLQQRMPNGCWYEDDGNRFGAGLIDEALMRTAYIASAVFADGAAASEAGLTKEYLLTRKPGEVKDAYTIALMANALLAIDPSGEAAAPYLDWLEATKQFEAGRFVWWKHTPLFGTERTIFYASGVSANVETTALATLALLKSKRHPATASAALAWLVTQKDPRGTWHSTQATVLAFKALIAGTRLNDGEKDRVVEIKLGDKLIQRLEIAKDQFDVMQTVDLTPHLGKGESVLTMTEPTGTGSGYLVSLRYHLAEAHVPTPEPNAGCKLELAYDRTEVTQFDMVKVDVKLTAPKTMVMLELPIPPGFAVVAEDFEELVQKKTVAKYQVEARRVLVYLEPTSKRQLSYRLQATLPVKALAPAGRIYEYYAPEREARTVPVLLTVKAR